MCVCPGVDPALLVVNVWEVVALRVTAATVTVCVCRLGQVPRCKKGGARRANTWTFPTQLLSGVHHDEARGASPTG